MFFTSLARKYLIACARLGEQCLNTLITKFSFLVFQHYLYGYQVTRLMVFFASPWYKKPTKVIAGIPSHRSEAVDGKEGWDSTWEELISDATHTPHVRSSRSVSAIHHFRWHVFDCPGKMKNITGIAMVDETETREWSISRDWDEVNTLHRPLRNSRPKWEFRLNLQSWYPSCQTKHSRKHSPYPHIPVLTDLASPSSLARPKSIILRSKSSLFLLKTMLKGFRSRWMNRREWMNWTPRVIWRIMFRHFSSVKT